MFARDAFKKATIPVLMAGTLLYGYLVYRGVEYIKNQEPSAGVSVASPL